MSAFLERKKGEVFSLFLVWLFANESKTCRFSFFQRDFHGRWSIKSFFLYPGNRF